MSDTTLILELLHKQDEKRDLQVKGIQKSMDAGFNTLGADMREMKDENKIRNGRTESLEGDVERVEKETWVPRWMHNHPGKTAPALLLAPRWVAAAVWALVLYTLLQIVGAAMQVRGFSRVSYLAHLGGLVAGLTAAGVAYFRHQQDKKLALSDTTHRALKSESVVKSISRGRRS